MSDIEPWNFIVPSLSTISAQLQFLPTSFWTLFPNPNHYQISTTIYRHYSRYFHQSIWPPGYYHFWLGQYFSARLECILEVFSRAVISRRPYSILLGFSYSELHEFPQIFIGCPDTYSNRRGRENKCSSGQESLVRIKKKRRRNKKRSFVKNERSGLNIFYFSFLILFFFLIYFPLFYF